MHVIGCVVVLLAASLVAGDLIPPPVLPTPGPLSCKGSIIISNASGDISSPDIITPGLNCSWILAISDVSKDIFFWIKFLDLAPGDELVIYNGTAVDKQAVIQNFTGQQEFGVVYSLAINTTLVFTSSNTTNKRDGNGFKLGYSTSECIVHTSQTSSGLLNSPYYVTSKNGKLLKCTYNITKPNGLVDVTFVQMALKKGQVLAKEGNTTLASYTDVVMVASDVISTTDSIQIEMILSTLVSQNFTLAYTRADPACSKMINITKPGEPLILNSPGYPNNYQNNHDCRWIIQSPINTTMRLEFLFVQLADSNDHVTIKDGGSLLNDNIVVITIGDNSTGMYYQTSDNITMIQFQTDQLQKGRGFNLSISFTAYGQRFVDMGNFSLGIPANKTNSSKLAIENQSGIPVISYQFQAPGPNWQVYLVLGKDAVILPNTTIECYDGFSVTDPLVAYFTTVDAFRHVFSNGNRLLIRIKGFLNQNGTMTHQYLSGSFSSGTNNGTMINSLDVVGGLTLKQINNSYPQIATWLIHNHLQQDFVSLKLHGLTVGVNSSVTVYEGLSDQDPHVAIFNQSTTNVPVIYISKDKEGCRVTYETRNSTTPKITASMDTTILQATYSLVPDCSMTYNQSSGLLTSPDYPNLYPYNAQCTWNVNVTKNKMLHLSFSAFELAKFHTVEITGKSFYVHNVTVGNKTVLVTNVTRRSLGMYSGEILPYDVISGRNESQVEVKFSSSYDKSPLINVARGLNMSFEILDCGGNLSASSASLNIPTSRNTSIICVWIIVLPNTTKHAGAVNVVSFTYSNNGNSSNVVIRDGPSIQYETIPLNASSVNPVLSRTNTLWVQYRYKPRATHIKAVLPFQLNFTSYECEKEHQCNNTLCMHDDWKCNGIDECGDGSDEIGCHGDVINKGYAGWSIAVAIIVTFVIAVILTLAAQAVYKRYRYPNYDELRDLMAPVPT